ncbi:MAG TPA: hypothetical protein VFN67_03970, partial [Polyangiales bacterium]|nr:hypothetical protein [Polyangiales bacterium]
MTRYSLHAAADMENADAITTLQTLEAARLWLARVYKVRDSHCGDVNSGPSTSPARDPASYPEWVVAEIFDPPPACATKLWEFLAHPGIELAIAAIHKICEEEREDFARASRLRESIDLWVQTLVGTLHRLNPPFRDDLALGIVRWLHRLSQWASDYKGQKMAVRSGAPSVARAADDAVFDVRRWTLFAPQTGKHAGASGHPSQERPYRPGIAYQLSRLDGLVARKDAMRRELEEAVVKESLLFHHRIDEEAVVSHDALFKESNREPTTQPQQVRGAPYHVAWLDLTQADTALCSVVFRQQCIKLFDVDIAPEFKSHDSATVPRRLRLRSTIPLGTASRFGRAAVLWSSEGRRCLLTTKNHGSGEQLCLYDVTERAWAPLFFDDVSESNPDLGSDCVYSFHFVEEASNRWRSSHTAVVLMGVRRDDGCAEFEILHITLPLLATGGSPRYALARTTVRLADARGSAIPNPVHCLHYVAQKRPRAESHHYYIVAGCDDGTVFLIEGTDLSTFAEARPRIVARLAAPVWTIQCRLLRDGRIRVYAGTADGHIVAWEQLPPKQASARGLSQRQEPAAWEFAGLWSTREGRGIVSLSSFAAPLNEPDQASPLLLAVSRNGRATLFADHEHVDARGHEGRPRVPGQRLERFNLQSTAFASATVQVTKALGTERPRLPPVVRLIVATGDCDVRLVALHQPKRSEIRKQRYGMLGEVWFRSLCPPDSTQIEPRRLRYTEALRAMAPGIWLLPVRFFIPTSAEDVAAGYQKVLRNVHPDWFPLHLRNYVRAAQAHASVMRALLDPQFNAKTMLAHADVMCRELEQALRDAHELKDKKLFQEITLSVGLGLNAALLHVCADTTLALAARVARDECMEQLYTRVLEV